MWGSWARLRVYPPPPAGSRGVALPGQLALIRPRLCRREQGSGTVDPSRAGRPKTTRTHM
eukprot:3330774-Lingulodinium_polyedra.AAC.1